jgi:ribose transport system ATP-binding protein
MGVGKVQRGSILVDGQPMRLGSVPSAIQAGLALVPEDRRHMGLVTSMSVGENLTLASLERVSRWGVLLPGADQRVGQSQVDALRIKTPSLRQVATYLSGGNQQKIVFGKWIITEPKVLLLDEPTRGVDIGAKQEIYGLMEHLAEQGVAILFVSSEMEEILGMSDRAYVMHEGMICGELARSQMSEQSIMELALGRSTVHP